MSDELREFFTELSPRLKAAQALDDKLNRKVAHRFNVLRYLRTDENGLSRMIADLLDPKGDHGQGDTFLGCLTDGLGFAKGCKLSSTEVAVEKWVDVSGERRRLDILVKIDGEHCIVIENKSNWANDQPDQVEAYLKWLKQEGYDQHLLVFLSPNGQSPSEASVQSKCVAQLKTEIPRRLAIMACGPGEVPDDDFNELRLDFSLVDWLADCRRNCDVDRLRWYLREIETYCNKQYGGNTVTDDEMATIEELLRSENRFWTAAADVHAAYPELRRRIFKKFLGLLETKLKHEQRTLQWAHDVVQVARTKWPFVAGWSDTWNVAEGNAKGLRVSIRLEEHANSGAWYIGVRAVPTRKLNASEDQKRRERLGDRLSVLRPPRTTDYWPWLDRVCETSDVWYPLVGQMAKEVSEGRGELSEHIVDKFGEIIDSTRSVLDEVYGA